MNPAAADDRQAAHSDAPKLDPDVLATVIDETARRVEARAARPSPVHLRSWEEIERFAEKAARSGMVPKDYIGKPDAIAIAVQMGSELGLAPVQSVQNIAVINGRPAIWGDALPGLCRASGMCKSIREWSEGEGDNQTFYCEAIRKDQSDPVVAKFSVADAKRAKLWQESPTVKRRSRDGGTYEADSGPWYSYPDRMLQMRARGFALRDAFPDVLKGLLSAEEARDIPWEDTGLSIVPPVATAASIRAAAAPMPRGERKVGPTPYEAPPASTHVQGDIYDQHNIAIELLDVGDSRTWMSNLEMLLAEATSLTAVEVIGECESVKRTIEKAPGSVRARVSELLANACKRFIENDPTVGGEELADVEIEGADKMAAG